VGRFDLVQRAPFCYFGVSVGTMAGRLKGYMMKILAATVAAILTLAFAEPSLGVSDVEAASSFCKYRYNACASRCQQRARGRNCFDRCRHSYHTCTPPFPSLGSVLF